MRHSCVLLLKVRRQLTVIGPRPHAVAHNEQYRRLVTGTMLRDKVKSGITGWVQVNGWRGETDTVDKMQHRVECDLHTIRNWLTPSPRVSQIPAPPRCGISRRDRSAPGDGQLRHP